MMPETELGQMDLMLLVQCIIDLQSISLLNLLGVSKTVEIGAA